MGLHVAGHILEEVRGTRSGVCGFCGQVDGCKSWLNTPRTGKAAPRIYSRCPLAPIAKGDQGSVKSITLKTANEYTPNNPCTNAPMSCIFCKQWEWKYSMSSHVAESNSSAANMRRADPDGQHFFEYIAVSEAEKKAVGSLLKRRVGIVANTIRT
ncbi:unnamed protein product [Sphacelaria rigidula]